VSDIKPEFSDSISFFFSFHSYFSLWSVFFLFFELQAKAFLAEAGLLLKRRVLPIETN